MRQYIGGWWEYKLEFGVGEWEEDFGLDSLV